MNTPMQKMPIRELIANLDQHLLRERNYSIQVLKKHYRPFWEKVSNYAEANGYETVDMSWVSELLTGYLESIGKTMSYNTVRKYHRAADILCEYQEKGQVIRRTKWIREIKNAEDYKPLYDAIEQYSSRHMLHKQTRIAYLNEINKLILFLEKKGISVDAICAEHIREYLMTLSYHAQSTLAYCHYVLRTILKLVYEAGQTTSDLSLLCEHIRVPQGRNIPSSYSPEEVEKLLLAVDRSNITGIRDYAILLIATRLGLRVSDIRTLKFENIDWVTNQIRLTQTKTGNELALPLPEDVGWAIIDYVKNARPKTESNCIFIRHIAPFNQFAENHNFSYMVGKYFTRAGIVVPRGKQHGMHSLRHSLASNMLVGGTPLPIVSEVLGHSNIKSTSVYLKIDISQLRKCSLDTDLGGDAQ